MHLLSLKTFVMLKMPFVAVMDISLMVIGYELNLPMVGNDIHHQWITIVITVVVEVVVVHMEFQSTLITELWSLDYLLLPHGKI